VQQVEVQTVQRDGVRRNRRYIEHHPADGVRGVKPGEPQLLAIGFGDAADIQVTLGQVHRPWEG